jgi:hypothetical protein
MRGAGRIKQEGETCEKKSLNWLYSAVGRSPPGEHSHQLRYRLYILHHTRYASLCRDCLREGLCEMFDLENLVNLAWFGFEILLLKFCLGNLVTNFDLGGLVWELWVVSFGLGT